MFLVILFSLPVLTCLWWALASGRVRRFPWLRGLLALLTMGNLAYLVLVIASRRFGLRWDVPLAVHIWGYSWFLITLPFAVFPITVAETLLRLYRWIRPAPPPPALESNATAEAPESDLSLAVTRRQLLQAGVAVFPLVLTGAATGRGLIDHDEFRIREINVPFPNLPKELDGFTIAHLSDTHVGRFTNGKVLERIVESMNGLDADLALVTGDLIDSQLKDLPPAVEMLSAIRATHGLYICEGNHDLFEGPKEFERGLRDAGLGFMLNESAVINLNGKRLALSGLQWGSRGAGRGAALEQNFAALLATRPEADWSILLAHHPHAFDQAAEAGYPLTLAGHTHGGQLMLTPNFGAGSAMFKYWSGLYRRQEAALVVSNGVGNWMPVRVNAPAEIVRLRLLRGEPSA